MMKTGSCTKLIKNSVNEISCREEGLNKDEGRPESMYFVNTDWLDGLSQATMRPDTPVAILFTRDHPRGRCLRWSQGLWDNCPTPPAEDIPTPPAEDIPTPPAEDSV
ncbi:hypothetical protein ACOMHN_028483 [Nucella lapillus]